MKTVKTVFAIDPGLDAGWAAFVDGELETAGVFKTSRKDRWEVRAQHVADELIERACAFGPRSLGYLHMYVEYPQLFGGSGGQMVAARGDLGKLYFTVGCIAHRFYLADTEFELVSPNRWKGQLSKEVVCARLTRKLTKAERAVLSPLKRGVGSHDWDAAGIGLWALGRF